MSHEKNPALSAARRKPLAACCAALFALVAPDAFAATTWPVTNCSDHDPGSLRDVVANSALSGDTVDLSQLNSANCPSSTISLTTGAIAISQPTLTLKGPTSRITITGYYNLSYQNDILINHGTSGGTLYLNNLRFAYSHPASPASGIRKGGCIYSAGNVNLNNVVLYQCHATGSSMAEGGGIYVHGNLTMKYSVVTANSSVSGVANSGGGVWTGGSFTAAFSSISFNSAPGGDDGGVRAEYGATITSSTISGNSAYAAGGIFVEGNSSTYVKITNSTISGNSAAGYIGGLETAGNPVTIQNSTIAFNTAVKAMPNEGPGVTLGNTDKVDIESSILSNNTYGATENDFSASQGVLGLTITSHNSIVRAAPGTFRPATVTTACPLLGPLRDNGGPTQTRALMSRSPAIDAGNNSANLSTDQRGGPFGNGPARVSGPVADIGAYEVQQNDIIFNAGFDGCPVLF